MGFSRLLSDAGYQPGTISPWSVAVVAASGRGRERVAPLFRTSGGWGLPDKPHGGSVIPDPALDVLTVGGAPLLFHMITGGLAYCVVPSWQTVFDAAPLVALAMLRTNFEFTRLDNKQRLSDDDVISLFNDVHRPTKETENQTGIGTYKPIPPMLVSRRGGGPIQRRSGDGLDGYDSVADVIIDALHEAQNFYMELLPARRRESLGTAEEL